MVARLITFFLIVGLLAADCYLSFLFAFVLRMRYPAAQFPYTDAVVIGLILAWAAALVASFWANAYRPLRLLLVASPALIMLALYIYAMWRDLA